MTLLSKLKEKAVEGIKEKGIKGALKENVIKPRVKDIKEYEASRISLKKLQGKLEEIGYPTDKEFIEKHIGKIKPTLLNFSATWGYLGVVGYALGTCVASVYRYLEEPWRLPVSLAVLAAEIPLAYPACKMANNLPKRVMLKEKFRPEIEEYLEW